MSVGGVWEYILLYSELTTNSGDILMQSCLQSLTIQEEEILGRACFEFRREAKLAPLFALNPLRDCCMVSKL
jgi:hypothetical protein